MSPPTDLPSIPPIKIHECPRCSEDLCWNFGQWSEGLCNLEFLERCPECGYVIGQQQPVPPEKDE